jgi:transposase-like protein
MAAARSLAQFQQAFSDEASCAAFMFVRRWPDGFVCPACGTSRFAALKSRPRLFECLDCGRQTSITAGTAMHRSKLPLTTWFWAAHLMTTHSNGMSALQLQDQLGVTYKTAWLLTQKLRRSMVDPDREPLEGVVEVDPTEIPFREGDTFLERGNAGKMLVIGAVEVVERDTNKAKPPRKHAQISRHAFRAHSPRHVRRQFRRVDQSFRPRQRETRNHAAHGRPQIVSRPERLSTRSARRRQNGRAHCSAVDSPCVFADEALGRGHLSRTAPQARRYLSQ